MLDYFDVLSYLHEQYKPRYYLEIGVAGGHSLRLAHDSDICLGVDPSPQVDPQAVDGCRIEQMTSDDFFASSLPSEIFGGQPVDLVFIDGMHLFEFALRDFFNSEALTGDGSIIAIHDVLPIDPVTSSRQRTTEDWTGDVWKLPLCLLDHRADLRLSILHAPPSGLCLVRSLDPHNHTLRDGYDALVEQYRDLTYDYWESRKTELTERTADDLETRYWRLREESQKLREESEQLRRESEALSERLAASKAERDVLLASTSWRITAPLRRIGSVIRREES